ncbi:MAG: 16S rRNA (guanine(527)-N(7))-methyltransferase RsmG [Flavobacteriales bacterium]|nr:16S rRNA (guanine(527)-N(7))-methyltransferase RsmG [Flavobacteriales bacterium]
MDDGADLVFQHFPGLSARQQEQFRQLGAVYAALNARVNLISRKDIEHLYERHVLHSLGIAKVLLSGVTLSPSTRVTVSPPTQVTLNPSTQVTLSSSTQVTLSKPAPSRAEGSKRNPPSLDASNAQGPNGLSFIDVGTGGGFPLVPLAILFPDSTFHGIDGTGKKIAAVNEAIQALGLSNCTAEQVRSEGHRGKYDVIVSRAVTTLPEFIRMTKHLVRKGEGKLLYLKGGELADELLPIRLPLRVHELSQFFPGEFFVTKKVVEVEM